MKHLRHILIGILLLLTSCIENSIPYPVVTLQILGVEGEGFTCAPEDINTQERIVTLHLDEQTDISNVKIDKISVTENARSSKPLSGTFDLRTPLYITLSFYQDYEWTIVADQQIERYFEVESQIGAAEIDVDQLTAKAYVPEGTDLSDLKVTRLKLGPADITTMTPPIDELTSFESVRYVYVTYHGFEEKWSLYVEVTDTKIRFTQVDAWSGVIWAYAEGNSAAELGFRYRKTGEETWIEVDKEQINISGGAFDTCITGLTPETQYEVVAYSGSDETEVASVTTEAAPQLPNGGGKRSTKSSIPTWPTAFIFGTPATRAPASATLLRPTRLRTCVPAHRASMPHSSHRNSQVWSVSPNWQPEISLREYSTASATSRTASSASDNPSKPVLRLCTAGSNTTREC